MDDVRELDRILDEKYRDIIADQVPVALLGVELNGKAAYIAGKVRRSLVAGHGRKTDKDWGLLAGALEQIGASNIGKGFVGLEISVRPVAPSVHDPLRNTLMVEVEDLLPEVKVLQQRRSPRARTQRVLVIGYWRTLLRGQCRDVSFGNLMGLTAFASKDFCVDDLG